jgi:hypothetical protein
MLKDHREPLDLSFALQEEIATTTLVEDYVRWRIASELKYGEWCAHARVGAYVIREDLERDVWHFSSGLCQVHPSSRQRRLGGGTPMPLPTA